MDSLRSMLVSKRMYSIFHLSAIVTIAVGMLFLIIYSPLYDSIGSTLALKVISALMGVLGAPAALAIFFGMFSYLFVCDRVSSRLIWAIVFLATAWFGSSLYFFRVYKKQNSIE
jgi:ABC-type xylose transport system permease subunit